MGRSWDVRGRKRLAVRQGGVGVGMLGVSMVSGDGGA